MAVKSSPHSYSPSPELQATSEMAQFSSLNTTFQPFITEKENDMPLNKLEIKILFIHSFILSLITSDKYSATFRSEPSDFFPNYSWLKLAESYLPSIKSQ